MRKITALLVITLLVGLLSQHATSAQSSTSALQEAAEQAIDDGLPGVSIAVYSPDSGVVTVVAGKSNLALGTPVTPTDLSRIASISKIYIGAVIMQLIDEGKLSVTDKLAPYLDHDNLAHIQNSDKATIEHLLTHSSGIVDYYNEANFGADRPNQLDFTLNEALRYVWDRPAHFAPGKRFRYSNTNTVLLALVIEKITGQNFAQAIRSRIITPLRLDHTYTEVFEPVPVKIVHGYSYDGSRNPADFWKMQGAGLPDGAIVTTPQDMVTFMRALLVDGKLLKRSALGEMLKPRLNAGDGDSIGYHVFMSGRSPSVTYYHDGSIYGYQAWLSHDNGADVTIAVWGNGTGPDQDDAFGSLIEEIQEIYS